MNEKITFSSYETNGTFENDIMGLHSELEPLYKELHAYVRRKLYNIYGEVGFVLLPNISRQLYVQTKKLLHYKTGT